MAAEPRPADAPPPRPSLVDRAVAAVRAKGRATPRPAEARADPAAVLTAALILVVPLATLIGAIRLRDAAIRDSAAIRLTAASVAAAHDRRDGARALLRTAWERPTLGATIEAIARALPPEAVLLRAERAIDGTLTVEVAAPDPDRVAAALRRDPALAALRAVAQSPGDGVMRVTLEQAS